MREIALIYLIWYFLADGLVLGALCSGAVRCLYGRILSKVLWLSPHTRTGASGRRVGASYLLTLEMTRMRR